MDDLNFAEIGGDQPLVSKWAKPAAEKPKETPASKPVREPKVEPKDEFEFESLSTSGLQSSKWAAPAKNTAAPEPKKEAKKDVKKDVKPENKLDSRLEAKPSAPAKEKRSPRRSRRKSSNPGPADIGDGLRAFMRPEKPSGRPENFNLRQNSGHDSRRADKKGSAKAAARQPEQRQEEVETKPPSGPVDFSAWENLYDPNASWADAEADYYP